MMDRSRRPLATRLPLALAVALGLGLAPSPLDAAQAQPRSERGLLQQASEAETAGRVEAAMARLYELTLERPASPDVAEGRLRLARLLALSGDDAGALVQCQMAAEEADGRGALHAEARALATILARRLRATATEATPFAERESLSPAGLDELDEPTGVTVLDDGSIVVSDRGDEVVYRLTPESARVIARDNDTSAALILGSDTVVVADGDGLLDGAHRTTLTGTWDDRPRRLERIRALDVTSDGHLLIVDREFDGLLRCEAGSQSCQPWGAAGDNRHRTVKVGPGDFVFLLDDRRPMVRVLDRSGELIAFTGPSFGSSRLDEVTDVAVDDALGVFLLDAERRRVEVGALRRGVDGTLAIQPLGAVPIPREGADSLDRPWALGVDAEGRLVVAGRSSSTLLRFR